MGIAPPNMFHAFIPWQQQLQQLQIATNRRPRSFLK
jgi:hypothetical protein